MYYLFDKFYSKQGLSFGEQPSPELIRIVNSFGIKSKALDIGAGDGRNSLYLASHGFAVTAIDTSYVGIKKLNRKAFEKMLNDKITTVCEDVRKIAYPEDDFDLVVAVTLFDHLPQKDIKPLFDKVSKCIKPGGYFFARVHTVDDPGFLKQTWRSSELSKMIKHYFKPNELKNLFSGDFVIDEYEETISEDRSHGRPHFHGFATAIAHKAG
jgi:tellurite methyltransferase